MSRGFVDIQGTRVPAVQLELSGMPATVARDPSSPGTFLVHVRLSYPGQAQHCATLQLTDSQHPAMQVTLATDAPEATYRVDAARVRELLAGDALGIHACQRVTWLSRPQREGLIAFLSESPPAETATTTPGPPSSGTDQARAALNARRDALLACAGRDVVGVRASWDAAGTLAVSLQPPLAGGPEEECVRSQLSGVRIQGATSAGELVHVLSR